MKTALLIDDDDIFRIQLAEALAKHLNDCTILTAGNGRDAVNIMVAARIDFIITDLHMPGMDGYEFISYARMNHPSLPILAITGSKTPSVERRLHPLGIACIEKLFDIRDMVPFILNELAGTSAATHKEISNVR